MACSTLLLPLLVLGFFLTISSSSTAPIPLLSLLSLKATLVDPLGSLRDWTYSSVDDDLTLDPPWCSWSGVACDPATGEVTSLDLSCRNLSGSIAPELRLLSPTLTHLNLSRNSFSGSLSPLLFDLHRLASLDISHNDFNATFPSSVSNLRFLAVLNAYSNSFIGCIPRSISKLRTLEHLNLGGSYFNGSIPPELAKLPNLRYLHLAGNLLTGRLPHQLGFSLPLLEHLEIGYNAYDGGLPVTFGLLSQLRYLDVSSANLSGRLPPEIGWLTQLESLFLFKNRFTGSIPVRFSGLKALSVLDLSDNQLTGLIPAGFAELANLTLLSLMSNSLSGQIPEGIGTLPNLEVLNLWNNSLTGRLPQKLGSNRRLVRLDVSTNSLSGPIPPRLCEGNRLVRLILFSNGFESKIPMSLGSCTSLWRIRVEGNRIKGPIPTGFGSLPNLTYVDLSNNSLSGGIPVDLGNATSLEFLNVSGNPLGGTIPNTALNASRIQIFSASHCGLGGEIPSFESGCRTLYKIELEGNELSGRIPSDIGTCDKLVSLKLGRNNLSGEIPPELALLPAITEIDVSWNFLTGKIPPEFGNCTTLESLDVSFNRLAGPVPAATSLTRNPQPSTFAGNAGLCGEVVGKPCDGKRGEEMEAKGSAGTAIVWLAAAAVAAAGLVVLALGTKWAQKGDEGKAGVGPGNWRMMAFQRLNFTADDVAKCVAGSDGIVGVGSTGTVYRAKMPDGQVIAVKKLWRPKKDEPWRMMKAKKGGKGGSPIAEVEVLGSVRHRNIVRLLGWCSGDETTMLLYEYMPNGSLEELLHGKGGKGEGKVVLDWETRYRIAVAVAQGMSYLHHDCNPVVVHRDLKPSNILLDAEMEARVADFGVAKLIHGANQSMSVIAGSCGYIAPEYAYTLQVDERSDIYSYGVVLMEILSGRRSVEADYGEGNSIVEWVRTKVLQGAEGGAWDVLDRTVAAAGCKEVRKEMMLMLRVALLCTSKNPDDRPSMRDVLSMLQEAKPSRKVVVMDQQQQQQQKLSGGSSEMLIMHKSGGFSN
ncbi:uncharacterized protein [Typha latifolia]|uniref:uncharacterized protein n=1 Tax=Typha latifolia TaxID=4733 RepID=UPI003C2DE9DC